jgi:hypothetical protein
MVGGAPAGLSSSSLLQPIVTKANDNVSAARRLMLFLNKFVFMQLLI